MFVCVCIRPLDSRNVSKCADMSFVVVKNVCYVCVCVNGACLGIPKLCKTRMWELSIKQAYHSLLQKSVMCLCERARFLTELHGWFTFTRSCKMCAAVHAYLCESEEACA